MVEKNSGSEGAATEVSMKLTAPFVGETLEISVDPGANIALIGVESSDLSFSQSAESSTDLIIDVTGGGQIILEGFFFAADTALPAALTLDDGTVISTDQILADAGDVELGDLAPAAGGAAHGGGAGFGEAPDESIVDGLNQVGLLGNDEFPGGIEQPTEELLQDPTSPPVAVDDTNTVSEDEVLTASGNVLDNDSDADGDELTPTLLSDTTGEHGLLEFNADGSYIYTLDNRSADVQALGVGQTLTDTFTYQIDDGTGGMDTATLTITITGSNDTPEVTPDNPAVAQPDEGVVQEDVTLSVSDNALDNDDDPDGDTLTATLTVTASVRSARSISNPMATLLTRSIMTIRWCRHWRKAKAIRKPSPTPPMTAMAARRRPRSPSRCAEPTTRRLQRRMSATFRRT